MANIESATLILRSGDLIPDQTNKYGTCDEYILNMTWNNINLRTILGPLYDKYDLFNICLSNVSHSTVDVQFGTTADDLLVQICMTGLPFVNQTYSVPDCCNTSVAVAGIFQFLPNAINTVNYNHSHSLTFSKQQDQVNLNIYYQRIYPSQVGGAGPLTYDVKAVNLFPDVIFKFKIYGVDKTEHNNGGRIFKI
jgi:hypothetical protein